MPEYIKLTDKEGIERMIPVSLMHDAYDYLQAARSTTAVPLGTNGGAVGDILAQIEVVVVPTVADLVISDAGSGYTVTVPTTATVGDKIDVPKVRAKTTWQIDAHASGVGTVRAVGEFT